MSARAPWLPPGRSLHLPRRGTTFVRHHPAEAGRPTVLLLHGHAVTADVNWFAAYPALAERYGVVAIDHRGHGRGVRSRAPFTLEACADDAAAALGELGVDRVIAVGYSMGAPIAQLFWRRHPTRTAALVCCAAVHSYAGLAPPPGRAPALAARVRAVRIARMLSARVEPRLRPWLLRELVRTSQRVAQEAARVMYGYDASAWIGEVDVPHAVVLTELDDVSAPERQRRLVAALPAPSLQACAVDHSACLEPGNAFVPALLAALAAVEP